MQLTLVRQPESEIISLQEAKDYLNISHEFDDALINLLIKSTREAIETIVQKSIIKQTWEYVVFREEFSNLNSTGRPCVFGSFIKVPLPRPPILEILEIKTDDKIVDHRKVRLEKINNNFYLYIENLKHFEQCNRLIITYSAGIALTSDNVPYQIKLANLMLIANAYQDRYQPRNSISSGVQELLAPFLNLRIF